MNKKLNVLNKRETLFVESKDRIEKLEKSVGNLKTRSEKNSDENKCEQAGAELCQAHSKLKLFWPLLNPCLL